MPHQIQLDKKFSQRGIKQLTSFINTQTSSTDIGMVYFNLDHLISTYDSLVLEEYTTSNTLGEEKTKRRLKKEFSFHDWITTIWNDVNDACAGFYDFGLHVEHSRPNVVRIIDFTFKGRPGDVSETRPIFKFDPQGLASIARESSFSSKLDNDFASVISIAAQSPNNIHSLEAMSLKAFHKNIKNRFTSPENDEVGMEAKRKDQYDTYMLDFNNYNNTVKSLRFYIHKMNQSNYESELVVNTVWKDGKQHILPGSTRKPISPDNAKQFASQLEGMRNALEARYGEKGGYKGNDGEKNNMPGETKDYRPYIGSFREDTTYGRSAIIPITVNITLDGIGGIHPLQIFQINPDKLPKGYQNPNIVFVVKKETNKITSGQDWTTEITGYLSLIDGNPNEGSNSEELKSSDNITTPNELDIIDNEQNLTPEADRLRKGIKQLSSTINLLTFSIEEKIGASTITDPGPQLSSGGDIDPLLVDTAMSVFDLIRMELRLGDDSSTTNNVKTELIVKIRITSGNDLYHQNFSENSYSLHKVGKAMDFTITPYNPQTKAAVEKVLTESGLYFINDYETELDNHFHFQV